MTDTTELVAQPDMLPAQQPEQSPVMAMLTNVELMKELPVEKYERMFDLYERENARIAEMAFNSAFLDAKREMPVIPQSGYNESIKSYYAKLDDIHENAQPVWERHGFTYSVSHGDSPIDGNLRFVLTLRHVGGHSERHFWDSPPDQTNRAKTAMMANASATSYCERQLLLKVWGFKTGEDRDGQRFDTGDRIAKEHAAHLLSLLDDAGRTEAQFCRTKNVESVSDLLEREYEPARKQIGRLIERQQ